MVKRTFVTKGVCYASELALKNVTDLEKVIDWNIHNGMFFYRMSSDMFPWMSEYELEDLPDFQHIALILKRIGEKAYRHKLRLTYHPGAFNVMATNNETVLGKTIKELRQHGEIMDMIGLPRSPYAKINIHIGGAYGDKIAAIQRFVRNVSLLPITASNRLTVENDDKANMFSVSELMDVHQATGIPIVFDYHHHQFCTGGLTEEEAMVMAVSTWPKDIIPVVHYSSSKKIFEDATAPGPAHADYVYESIKTYGLDVDIMLEAKAKEMAVIKFKRDYASQ